jgi:hypothetical protein
VGYGVNERWGVRERGWVGNEWEWGFSVRAGVNEGLEIVNEGEMQEMGRGWSWE